MSLLGSLVLLKEHTERVYTAAIRENNNSAAFELSIISAKLELEIQQQQAFTGEIINSTRGKK
jgi:hypothetical protein